MGKRLGLLVLAVLVVAAADAAAAAWSRAYIRQLPDSAFAVVERPPKGKPMRRFPHHDATGALDLPHLCNAVARLPQVKCATPPTPRSPRAISETISSQSDQLPAVLSQDRRRNG